MKKLLTIMILFVCTNIQAQTILPGGVDSVVKYNTTYVEYQQTDKLVNNIEIITGLDNPALIVINTIYEGIGVASTYIITDRVIRDDGWLILYCSNLLGEEAEICLHISLKIYAIKCCKVNDTIFGEYFKYMYYGRLDI